MNDLAEQNASETGANTEVSQSEQSQVPLIETWGNVPPQTSHFQVRKAEYASGQAGEIAWIECNTIEPGGAERYHWPISEISIGFIRENWGTGIFRCYWYVLSPGKIGNRGYSREFTVSGAVRGGCGVTQPLYGQQGASAPSGGGNHGSQGSAKSANNPLIDIIAKDRGINTESGMQAIVLSMLLENMRADTEARARAAELRAEAQATIEAAREATTRQSQEQSTYWAEVHKLQADHQRGLQQVVSQFQEQLTDTQEKLSEALENQQATGEQWGKVLNKVIEVLPEVGSKVAEVIMK